MNCQQCGVESHDLFCSGRCRHAWLRLEAPQVKSRGSVNLLRYSAADGREWWHYEVVSRFGVQLTGRRPGTEVQVRAHAEAVLAHMNGDKRKRGWQLRAVR